jgi:hypothetical protein
VAAAPLTMPAQQDAVKRSLQDSQNLPYLQVKQTHCRRRASLRHVTHQPVLAHARPGTSLPVLPAYASHDALAKLFDSCSYGWRMVVRPPHGAEMTSRVGMVTYRCHAHPHHSHPSPPVTPPTCVCRKPRPHHATRRYSLIVPPARVCLRTRYCSRSTGSGSGFSGAAPCRER